MPRSLTAFVYWLYALDQSEILYVCMSCMSIKRRTRLRPWVTAFLFLFQAFAGLRHRQCMLRKHSTIRKIKAMKVIRIIGIRNKDNEFPNVLFRYMNLTLIGSCYSLGLGVACVKIASGEKVYYLRILYPLSNIRRRRCLMLFPSILRHFRMNLVLKVWENAGRQRQRWVGCANCYQFLWSAMVMLLAIGTVREAMERLGDGNRTR